MRKRILNKLHCPRCSKAIPLVRVTEHRLSGDYTYPVIDDRLVVQVNGRRTHRACVADLDQYEDLLPADMTDAEYNEWFNRSAVVDGVRMGPMVQ
jgi:hypothetical protein